MNSLAKIMAICCLMTACAAPRVAQDHQRDSVSVIIRDSIRIIDSLVLVPIPQGSDKAVLPDSDTSRLETDVAQSVAYVADGKLHHTLRNKDAALIPYTIKMPEKIHTEKQQKLSYHKIVEYVEVEKKLSRWQRFMMMLGWVVLVGAVAWLAWKIYKFIK